MNDIINATKAEAYKLKNLTGIHVLCAITWVISVIGAILMYRFYNWNRSMWESAGNDTDTIDSILQVSQDQATSVFSMFGPLVMAICAAVITAHEFKTNTHMVTRLYCPDKLTEFASKYIVAWVYTIVWTLIITTSCYVTAKIVGPDYFTGSYNLLTDNWAGYGRFIVIVTIYITIIQGVAFLLRSSLLSVIVFMVYTTFVETAIMFIPKLGSSVSPYLPMKVIGTFTNFHVHDVTPPFVVAAILAWTYTIAIYLAGVIVESRRDV